MPVSQRLLRNQGLRNLVPPRVKAMFAENRVRLARAVRALAKVELGSPELDRELPGPYASTSVTCAPASAR